MDTNRLAEELGASKAREAKAEARVSTQVMQVKEELMDMEERLNQKVDLQRNTSLMYGVCCILQFKQKGP